MRVVPVRVILHFGLWLSSEPRDLLPSVLGALGIRTPVVSLGSTPHLSLLHATPHSPPARPLHHLLLCTTAVHRTRPRSPPPSPPPWSCPTLLPTRPRAPAMPPPPLWPTVPPAPSAPPMLEPWLRSSRRAAAAPSARSSRVSADVLAGMQRASAKEGMGSGTS